jgi:hypothetical protein
MLGAGQRGASHDTVPFPDAGMRLRRDPTQVRAKVGRWHRTLKDRILLENDELPGEFAVQVAAFGATSRVVAGYLTLRNAGISADRLVGEETPAARLVEIHEHRINSGVMRMRPLLGMTALVEAIARAQGH